MERRLYRTDHFTKLICKEAATSGLGFQCRVAIASDFGDAAATLPKLDVVAVHELLRLLRLLRQSASPSGSGHAAEHRRRSGSGHKRITHNKCWVAGGPKRGSRRHEAIIPRHEGLDRSRAPAAFDRRT